MIATQPQVDPVKRAAVAELWRDSLELMRGSSLAAIQTRLYLLDRVGLEARDYLIENDLVGCLRPGAEWMGCKLWGPWRLVIPIYTQPPFDRPAELADEDPIDLALRAVEPVDGPKIKSLFEAAPGLVKTFGFIPDALLEADAHQLLVVEGALNFLAWRCALDEPRVIGLHGAGSARRVAEALAAELRHLRREGVGGPARLLIDTDPDEAGDRAAREFIALAARFDIPAERIERTRTA